MRIRSARLPAEAHFAEIAPGTITFEAVLEEGTNEIAFQYADLDIGHDFYDYGGSETAPPPPSGDTTPPQTTIDLGPPATTAATDATFAFSADEPASFECKLDDAGDTACASPRSYGALSVGGHSFVVRARDAAGNVDPTPADYTWTVEAVPPPPPGDTTPQETTSPRTYTGLSYATHTFRVRATDTAGNVDSTPAVWTWRIRRNAGALATAGGNQSARLRQALGVRSPAWKAARNWLKRCRVSACSRT